MPQQINLLTPILLTPKRHFSAQALLQACGLLLLAGAAAALWLHQQDRRAEAQQQTFIAQLTAERQALQVAQAGLPARADAASLQQQLLPLEAGNAARRALLQSLSEGTDGQRHSDLLTLVAGSLPEAAWLTELRYAPGRVEIVGGTLDTSVLRPWLGRLASHPLLAGQTLTALRVERLGIEAGREPVLAHGGLPTQTTLPVWTFRVVSAPAAAASSASGGTR